MEQGVKTADQYVIFQTGGKQYQAVVGKTLAVEKLAGDAGDTIEFNEVLFKKEADGKFHVGQPHVDGVVMKASIVKHERGKKIIVFRHKRRKKSRVKNGHRQPQTIIRIESI